MKKIVILFTMLMVCANIKAQPSALMELWKAADALQIVYCQQTADKAFLDVDSNMPVSDRRVESTDLLFGKSISATAEHLKDKGFLYEYSIENTHKLSGEYMGHKCDLFFTAINDIVFEYSILFKQEYSDFQKLKSDFAIFEHALNSIFTEPTVKGRTAETKYMPLSSAKNDKGITYGNIYNTADGVVFIHPTPFYTLSGLNEGVKLMIYFLHDGSLQRALK